MTNKRAAVLAALGILAAAAAPALAQDRGWGMIGQRQVSGGVDHDTIPARGGEQYRQIMFCVEDAPIRFRAVTIRFQGGTSQQMTLRDRIAAGRCGAAITLRGRDRDVAGIDIAYEAASLGGATAKVQAYAR